MGPDEPWERLLALRGMTAVSPMLDLRVITAHRGGRIRRAEQLAEPRVEHALLRRSVDQEMVGQERVAFLNFFANGFDRRAADRIAGGA